MFFEFAVALIRLLDCWQILTVGSFYASQAALGARLHEAQNLATQGKTIDDMLVGLYVACTMCCCRVSFLTCTPSPSIARYASPITCLQMEAVLYQAVSVVLCAGREEWWLPEYDMPCKWLLLRGPARWLRVSAPCIRDRVPRDAC